MPLSMLPSPQLPPSRADSLRSWSTPGDRSARALVDSLREARTRGTSCATRSCSSSRSAASLTTGLFVRRSSARARRRPGSSSPCPLWLWFTVLFANFAEAMAEGRGKAQADSLRRRARDTTAKKLARGAARRRVHAGRRAPTLAQGRPRAGRSRRRRSRATARSSRASPRSTRAAITGESAPVIRESGGDRSAVTGGTRVLSDWLVVRVTAESRARPSSTG